MKYFKYLFFVLLFAACNGSEESLLCDEQEYDKEFHVQLGESVCFPDGNSFEVKNITDQFCCCFCNCIWAGQLEVILETTNTSGEKDLFTFGSEDFNEAQIIFKGYELANFDFLYDGEADVLPLCEGEYEAEKVELILTISTL